jgi:hypothetical protein
MSISEHNIIMAIRRACSALPAQVSHGLSPPKWSVISEVFDLMGPGQTNPRLQSGLRYSPTKRIDWDLIYGRNLSGEGANWITLGLTLRTGPNGSEAAKSGSQTL